MITPGQRLPGAWVPSAADLKVRTPKTEIPSQSYQAVALETRDSDRLLHPRRERPRDSRATKRRDELASPHGRTPRPRITNYSRSRCASQQKATRSCPLWVISRQQDLMSRSRGCPLYPQKRTSSEATGMSALCQKRTCALQQMTDTSRDDSFDHPVGAGEERRRHVKTKCLCSLQIDYDLVFGRRLQPSPANLGSSASVTRRRLSCCRRDC